MASTETSTGLATSQFLPPSLPPQLTTRASMHHQGQKHVTFASNQSFQHIKASAGFHHLMVVSHFNPPSLPPIVCYYQFIGA
jgi:hypothetical protein